MRRCGCGLPTSSSARRRGDRLCHVCETLTMRVDPLDEAEFLAEVAREALRS